MKRIKGDPLDVADSDPLPRPLMFAVRVIHAIAEFGDELVEAAIMGLRAGAWFAILIIGFAVAFLAIGVAVYAGLAWIVSRFS
jgi:hypothetical protein